MSSSPEFEARLRDSIAQSITIGYNPTRFTAMLNTQDAVSLAKHLVASGEIQDGMQKVVDLGRSELAMESIMLEADFSALFTQGELDAAQWRLQQAQNAA